jgi:HSP20 family molecular chaperone IbpA|tara:strand:+ start:617 stop:973 length:357 start_codon:yes stop_codon:yes gene_type:complete
MRTLSRYNNVWDIFDTWHNNVWSDVSSRSSVLGYFNETENNYEYELELPGYSKKNVTISAVDGVITINAVKGEKTRKFSVGVPEDADLSSIEGQLTNGLLTLKVEKQEKAKPITVKLK